MSFCPVFRSRPRVWLCGVLSVAMSLFAPLRTPAQNVGEMREYQKKAECLASFTRFVEWPEHKCGPASPSFVIGIFGEDRMTSLLREALRDRLIKGRPVIVRHLTKRKELRSCHVVFVSRSEHDQLRPILRLARQQGILTVGENDDFLSRGGVINFVSSGAGVRFQINADAAAREHLAISSKLLQLAVPATPAPGLAPAGGLRPAESPQQAKAR